MVLDVVLPQFFIRLPEKDTPILQHHTIRLLLLLIQNTEVLA
jgi:hypothetical protein